MKQTELYILLGDKCNFSCSHCLNKSGPKAKRWNLMPEEALEIAKTVNSSSEVAKVHFSGGEPTLYMNEIGYLQAQIQRDVKYAITTNGTSFADSNLGFGSLKIDEVILSYDVFRKNFIDLNQIINIAKKLEQDHYDVTVSYLVSSARDLIELKSIQSAGVKVYVSSLIESGRFKRESLPNAFIIENPLERTCPSIQDNVTFRDSQKAIYFPGWGYSSCCGPLAFDELIDREHSFSPKLKEVTNLKLNQSLAFGTFQEQYRRSGFDTKVIEFPSTCEACTILYGKENDSNLPSLDEISAKKSGPQFYRLSKKINKIKESLLLQKFNLGYIYGGHITPNQPPNINSIHTEDVTGLETRNRTINFIVSNYYERFPQYYSSKDVEAFRDASDGYFSLDPKVRIFTKGDVIVGAFMANYFEIYPPLGVPTVHVGYWGYDKSLVTREEAIFIKSQWLLELNKMSRGKVLIDVSVAVFNQAGTRLVEKIGLRPKALRLDPRE